MAPKDLISHPPVTILKPVGYFRLRRQRAALLQDRRRSREDLFMFSSDYPHADRTEGTAERFAADRDDIPAHVGKMLDDNARRFYGPLIDRFTTRCESIEPIAQTDFIALCFGKFRGHLN